MSARTLPRKTQYDHAVYIKITGSRNSVPINRNTCVEGLDAACHSVSRCGTTYGNRLMPRPRYDNANSAMAPMNGPASESGRLRLRHSSHTTAAVTIGTGVSSAMSGHENQRLRMSGNATVVQMLTKRMATHTPRNAVRP